MADTITWILITVAALVAIAALMVLLNSKKKGKPKETDYRSFFLMGISWLLIGFPLMLIYRETFNALFVMGMVFTIMGAVNKDKWKDEPLPKNQKMMWAGVFAAMLVLAAVAAYARSMAA
jgi:predicted membrane channel-forming protein YqfA (hemolysin III family)